MSRPITALLLIVLLVGVTVAPVQAADHTAGSPSIGISLGEMISSWLSAFFATENDAIPKKPAFLATGTASDDDPTTTDDPPTANIGPMAIPIG